MVTNACFFSSKLIYIYITLIQNHSGTCPTAVLYSFPMPRHCFGNLFLKGKIIHPVSCLHVEEDAGCFCEHRFSSKHNRESQKPGIWQGYCSSYLSLSVVQRVLWLSQGSIIDQANLGGQTWVKKWEICGIWGRQW